MTLPHYLVIAYVGRHSMTTVFGNLPTVNAQNCPKKILHIDFSDCTLGAVTFSSTKNYNQSITIGNLNSSVMTSFLGSSYVLQCQSIVDVAVADATAFTAVIENSIVTVPGPFGNNVAALYQNIKSKALDPGTNPISAPNQTWVRILRALQPGSVKPSAIENIYISSWRKLQVNGANALSSFLEADTGIDPSGQAFWLSLRELKKGFIDTGSGPNSSAGDARFIFRSDKDTTGMHWLTRWDNSARGVVVPGIPSNLTFVSEKDRTPLPPSNEWFKLETLIEHKNGQRRTVIAITPASTGVCTVISNISVDEDILGTTSLNGAQTGIYGEEAVWSQLFLDGLYADAIQARYPLNGYVHDLQVWASEPRQL